ncbi:MAG: heme exporter protein CcmD [Hyphomicrobiales bacterium]
MDFSAPHIAFVLVAYGITFAVLAGLVIVTVFDIRSQRAQLARLEDEPDAPRRRRATDREVPSS